MIGKMDLPRGKRTKSGEISDFITIYKEIQPDFKGVFRLFIDIGGEFNKGVLLISNNEVVAVSLRNIDRGTEISGNDALNQVRKHILASVGDLDVYSYIDSEMNRALSVNRYALLTPPLDLGEFQREFALGEEMKKDVVEEEPGGGKPEEEVKEGKEKPKEEKKPEEEVKERKRKPEEDSPIRDELLDIIDEVIEEVKEGKKKPEEVKEGKEKPKEEKKPEEEVKERKKKPEEEVKERKKKPEEEVKERKKKPDEEVKERKKKPKEEKKPDEEVKKKLKRGGLKERKEELRRRKIKERKKKPKEEKKPEEEAKERKKKPEEEVKERKKKPKEEKKPEKREIRERKDYVSQGAFEEINAISSKHLNTLLSTMIDKKVEMKGIGGGIFPINKIPRSLRFRNELIAGIYLRVGGEINGSSMLLFPRNSALSLVDIKKGQETGTTGVLTREDRSILRELGGVIIFSYMNTLSDFLDINLQFSAPSIAFDMANSITRFMLSTIPGKISHILLLKADFLCGGKKEIRATFIFLLDKKSTNFLLKKINRKKRG